MEKYNAFIVHENLVDRYVFSYLFEGELCESKFRSIWGGGVGSYCVCVYSERTDKLIFFLFANRITLSLQFIVVNSCYLTAPNL